MTKERKRIIRLLAFYAFLIVLLAWVMPKELNWSLSFSKDKTWPYGSKILFEQLTHIFPGQNISTTNRPLYNTLSDTTDQAYISISDVFSGDKLDINSFLEYIHRGNKAFLSSINYSQALLDTLNIELNFKFKSNELEGIPSEDTNIDLQFINPELSPEQVYSMRGVRFYHHFMPAYDSIPLHALGYIEQDKICFVKLPFGEGAIYLHSFPYAFTNYHMLQEDNLDYVSKCLSYLPVTDIIWDEYYKLERRNRQESPLQTILQSRSMRWAYWLGIASLFAFMLFQIKRKQAPIPVLRPFSNDSLQFTQTIGDLYFEKGSNRDLVLKKINVFKAYLHRQYFFENIRFEEKEIRPLSEKTGQEQDFIRQLWAEIQHIKKVKLVSDQQLNQFSQMLNRFYGRIHPKKK